MAVATRRRAHTLVVVKRLLERPASCRSPASLQAHDSRRDRQLCKNGGTLPHQRGRHRQLRANSLPRVLQEMRQRKGGAPAAEDYTSVEGMQADMSAMMMDSETRARVGKDMMDKMQRGEARTLCPSA